MMKKNGFTLAEVLITLAIIGVVATLTLPALMTNTAEQQAKTAFKKGINTLTEAAQMNAAISGYDYSSLTSSATNSTDEQSLYGLLATRTSVDFSKSGIGKQISMQGSTTNSNSSNYTIFFRDGSSLSFDAAKATSSGKSGSQDANKMQSDGLPYGITALYDTNGTKGPNILSNCDGNALGKATDVLPENKTANDVCTKDKRVIKDQFGVRLRGYYAVPNGAASQWAFQD